jgi:hypothetical protein
MMGKSKRIRKNRMKINQEKRFKKMIKKLIKDGKDRCLIRCLTYGHDYRDDVFHYGDRVCICCGDEK